jgi:hypothetical protein
MTRRNLLSTVAALAVALWAFSPAMAKDEAKDAGDTHEGVVVKAGSNSLVMADKDGKNQHTHAVAADAKITIDGKEGKLEDLKKGTHIKVTTTKSGEKTTATKIEASTKDTDK